MKPFIDKLALFLAAMLVSIALHAALFAWVSGIRGFDFINSFRNKEMFVNLDSTLEREGKPPKPSLPATKPDIKQEAAAPPVKEQVKDSPIPEAAAKGEEGKEEGAEPLEEEAEAEDDASSEDSPIQLLKYAREAFHYDISWIGVHVGKALLKASNENGAITITSQVHSSPFISTFYRVEDHAESRVVNGTPLNFRIRQHEGKYRSDKETLFDTGSRKVTFINYLKNTRDEHVIEGVLPWDLISGFYYLRTQTLEPGNTSYIDVFDSNRFFKAEITALRNERITVPATGEVDAVVVRLILKSEGLFQSTGNILIWLTNDERKIPVRVEAKAPVGYVVAELSVLETEK